MLMAERENRTEFGEHEDLGIGQGSTGKLWVKDRFVDALGIDEIMEEVFHMNLKDRNRITEELMVRFIRNNMVDGSLQKDYRTALIDEYERRLLPYL
jgi:hypothetical protein